MIRSLATAGALIVLGIVLAGLGVHQLGAVRAARKWPSARQPRIGRGIAGFEAAVGIVIVAVGCVLLTTLLPGGTLLHVGVGAGVGIAVLVVGMLVAAKVADRVELNALIRSPSPLYRTTAPRPGGHPQTATTPTPTASAGTPEIHHRHPDNTARPDPAVPPGAQPGWVLTDADGGWYLCVAGEAGPRLVQLPDFRLAAPDASRRLTVAGAVELSVWPLEAAVTV